MESHDLNDPSPEEEAERTDRAYEYGLLRRDNPEYRPEEGGIYRIYPGYGVAKRIG